jgi:hypothetical protein
MGDRAPERREEAPAEFVAAFLTALRRLVADAVRAEMAERSDGGIPSSDPTALRTMVTEAVGAVLFETKVLDRAIERRFQEDGASTALREETVKVVRDHLSRNLGILFQTEIRGVIQKEIRAFMASDELKEMIDEKFRTISSYLASDVIPRAVHQELERSH